MPMTKINLGKKLWHMANAVVHGVRPKRYRCKFMQPGLTNYPGEGGKDKEMWLITREVMDQMQPTYMGCPVVIQDLHDGNSTPDTFGEVAVGVVSEVGTDSDNWDWANLIIWDEDTQKAIERNGFNVSCAYNTIESDPGGTLNDIDYDHEVRVGEYIHMAIVKEPRQTGAKIFLNAIDKPEARDIIFFMNGKKYKLFCNGKSKKNAKSKDELKGLVERAIDNRDPLPSIVKLLREEGLPGPEVQSLLETVMREKHYKLNSGEKKKIDKILFRMRNSVNDVKELVKTLDLDWEELGRPQTVKQLADKLGWSVSDLTDPMGLRNGKTKENIKTGIKKNQGGNDMKKFKAILNAALKKAGLGTEKIETVVDEVEEEMCEDEDEIDIENAVIETPDGDVSLKDMVSAYEEIKNNKKNAEDEGADEDEELTLESEYEGVPIKDMYSAYQELKASKKNKEDVEAKANADRKAALKGEGKTDEEIESILESEAEAADEDEKREIAKKNAIAAKAKAEEAQAHFNSLNSARSKFEVMDDRPKVMTRSKRIQIAKDEY